jgi:hypothetical protein
MELQAFLATRKVKASECPDYTHLSFSDSDASLNAVYKIDPADLEQLFGLVDKLVEAGGNFPLLERRPEVFPLLIDLDFCFKTPVEGQRVLDSERDIRPFIQALDALYRQHLQMTDPEDGLAYESTWVVERRLEPYKTTSKEDGEIWKDGLHIACPVLRATPETHIALRAEALRQGLLKAPSNIQVLHSPEKWWDESVIRKKNANNWFVNGLGKTGKPRYELMNPGGLFVCDGSSIKRKSLPEDEAKRLKSLRNLRRKLSLHLHKGEVDEPVAVVSLPGINPDSSTTDPSEPATSSSPSPWKAINQLLGLPDAVSWNIHTNQKGNLIVKPATTKCLCDIEHDHAKAGGSTLQVRITSQRSGKPYAMMRCWDYEHAHKEKRPDDKTTLRLIQLLEPLLEQQVEDTEEEDIHQNPDYLEMKEGFENFCFKVLTPVAFNVKIEDEWIFHDRSRLLTLFENKFFKNAEGKQTSFIKTWLTDEHIKTFTRTGFYPDPSTCPESHFNEFKGFAFEKYMSHEPVECPELLQLMTWLCGNDEKARDYMLDWMAQIIQQPSIKSGICPVFGGGQGTGKDFTLDWFRRFILGDDVSLMTAQPETDLFGSFSTRVKNRLFIKLEEGEGKTFHGNSDKFKNFITAPTTTLHPKGIDPTTIIFPARFAITTNNFNAVKVEPEDRRFVFFRAHSHPYVQNRVWFGALAKRVGDTQTMTEPAEPGIIRWFVDLLKARDLSKIDFIKDRPLTKHYMLMRVMNTPHHFHFLEWLVSEDGFNKWNANLREVKDTKNLGFETTPFGVHIKGEGFFKCYEFWITLNNQGQSKMTQTKFGCVLQERDIDGLEKQRTKSGTIYKIKSASILKFLKDNNLLQTPPEDNACQITDED